MSTIDQRVVRMEFQNSQFESGIKSSIKSLNDLKSSLNISGATKGLDELGDSVKHFSLDSIGESVDQISQKFTALGIAGVTALQNITNKAVDAGLQMAKSLTVDQITAGFSKYEQKTASVQTLMNSTGKSIEEINGYLDKLMWFSDETSYGFTDMTSALAQMTITGGDIEKLVPMLMGVANATAFAGKGANEFSHIIYNLAQSYGTGALKLIDWKSVELMGGASIQLKQALIDAGEALGTIEKGQITIANFSDTLTKGEWATQEVMEMAFGSFAEMTEKAYEMVQSGEVDTASEAYEILAQTYDNVAMKAARSAQEAKTFGEAIDATKDAVSSGWMATFDIIFGNYEEAKILWTDLANGLWDLFAAGAADRNEMLQTWKDLGGRDSLISSAKNIIEAFAAVLRPIGDAFRTIFPPVTAERLLELTKGFEEFTSKLILSEDASHGIQKVFEGIFTVVKLLLSPLKLVIAAIGVLPDFIGPLVNGFLHLVGVLGDASSAFLTFENLSQIGIDLFNYLSLSYYEGGMGLAGILEAVFDSINDILTFGIRSIGNILGVDVEELIEKQRHVIHSVRNVVVDFVLNLQRALLSGDWSEFQNLFDFLSLSYYEGGMGLAGVLEALFDSINEILTFGIRSIANAIGIDSDLFIESMRRAIQNVRNVVVDFVLSIQTAFSNGDFSKIHEGFSQLSDAFSPVFEFVNGAASKALEVVTDILIAFGAKLVPIGETISNGATKIGDAINPLTIFRNLLNEIVDSVIGLFGKLIDGIGSVIDKLDYDRIYKTFNVSFFGMFALGIYKVGKAISDFSKNANIAAIPQSISAVGYSLARAIDELGKSFKTFQTSVKAEVVKKIAISVGILSASLLVLSKLEPEELGRGIAGLTLILSELSGAVFIFGKSVKDLDVKQIGSTGLVIVELAAAVLVLSIAVKKLAGLSWEELVRGLTGTGIALGELVGATILLSKYSGKIEKSGLSMFALALSIKTLAKAVSMMAKLSWEELVEGLAGVGVLLFELSKFTTSSAPLSKDSALSFIELSIALLIFSAAVKKMGSLDFEQWAQGLAGVGILLFELSKFSSTTTPQTKSMGLAMIELAAAMLVLGFAISKFGSMEIGTLATGLIAMGIALAEVSIALNYIPSDSAAKAAGVLVLAMALVPLAGAMALIGALPLESIVKGLVGIGGSLLLFSMMMASMSDVSSDVIKISGAFVIFTAALIPLSAALIILGVIPWQVLLQGLIGMAGALFIFGAAGALLSPIADSILKVSIAFGIFGVSIFAVGAGLALLSAGLIALAGSAAAVVAVAGQLTVAISTAIGGIILGIGKGLLALIDLIGQYAPDIWNSFKAMFLEGINSMAEVVPQLVYAFLSLVTMLSPDVIESGITFLVNFLNGIKQKISDISMVVIDIIVGFVNGVSNKMGDIIESGFTLIQSFFNGLADGIENHLPELLESMGRVGVAVIDGLVNALGGGLSLVVEKIKEIGSKMLEGIKDLLGIHSPSTVFEDIGTNVVQGLINGLKSMIGAIGDVIGGIVDAITSPFKKKDDSESAGEGNIEGLVTGYKNGQNDAVSAISDIETSVINAIKKQDATFRQSGQGNLAAYKDGMLDKKTEIVNAITTILNDVISKLKTFDTQFRDQGRKLVQAIIDGVNEKKDEFKTVGENLVDGFVEGIREKIQDAAKAAAEMAKAALDAAMDELDERSPSKKFYRIGEYVPMGFAEGIRSAIPYSNAESREMAEEAIDTMKDSISRISDYLSEDLDTAPTIRPVLDLSDIRKGSTQIGEILSRNQVLNLSEIDANVKAIQANVASVKSAQTAEPATDAKSGDTYTFNQYNTSPKALSRSELYRQSKNLFSQFRGRVDKV